MRQMGEKIILVLCIVVFGIAAMNLVEIGKEYYDGQKEYEELKEYTEEKANGQQDDPTESEAEEQTIDFAELRKINEDIVAWIQISGIGVDYPVVQGEDNEYYLHHTFRKEANKAGSIFLDYRNRADFTEQRVLIYGHNMKDGSMFRGLRNFLDDEFLKEHHLLYLYLPDEGVWIFVVVKCEYTPADGDAFLLGTQEEVPTLLLSTCGTDASKRLVVWCERQEEKSEQIEYSDKETEVQKATDDLAFLEGKFVENETHDFI